MKSLAASVVQWFGGEQNGTVRTEDCRTQVTIGSSDLMTWYHTFTCEYDGSGNKTCTYVKTSGDHGTCEAAYVYYKYNPAPHPSLQSLHVLHVLGALRIRWR